MVLAGAHFADLSVLSHWLSQNSDFQIRNFVSANFGMKYNDDKIIVNVYRPNER